jgi:hypothetical protein
MKTRLLVTVGAVVLVAIAGILGGVPGGFVMASSNATDGNASTVNDTPMGTQISSFMGASAAAANGSVDNAMFSASFNATGPEDRPKAIETRTKSLEQRLERLQERKATLVANQENITRAAYVARMSAIAGQIESLKTAINQTSTLAETTGANVSNLETLKKEASNLTGQEIASLARNGTVGVGNPGRGPPNGTPGEGPPDKTPGEGPPNGSDNGTDQGEGNDGDQGEGNDGNQGEGNDGNQGQGNDGDQGQGNDGDQGEGNDGDQGEGNDGDQGEGNDGDQGEGNDGDQGEGNDGDQGEGNDGDQGEGNDGDQASGYS